MKKIKRFLNIAYGQKNIWHNALFVLVALIMVFFCFCTQRSVEWHKPETVPYPIEDITGQSQYIKQFDAFFKGQLHLDVEVSEVLLSLSNPYDPAARDEAGAVYYWDHAYFEGKYYSYFGIAPIATVYFPVYLATGTIPNDALACIMLAIYAVIFCVLAYREVVLRFCKKANIWLFLTGEAAFVAASGVYLGLLCSDIYYIAVISALASAISALSLPVIGTQGFKNAQVTAGGISLDEVDPCTMASRLFDGLYIAGEALDADGPCGGYNLHFAFAGALTAAKAIASQLGV